MAATALAVSGLAACGGEGEPAESSTTASPSAVESGSSSDSSGSESSSSEPSDSSASSTASETADLPQSAAKQSQAGAAAFGKYYLSQFGEASRTGDTKRLELLEADECSVCSAGIKEIKSGAQKGWTLNKNPYTASNVEATKRPDGGFKVSMDVKVAEHERLDSEGESIGTSEATQYTFTQHVVWENDRWQMYDWVVT